MNGTMVDAATYFEDTTTYTGLKGSETNPYCVEDCFDFLAMEDIYIETNEESDITYCMLVKDIDFNDHPTYKYGFNDTNYISRGANLRLLGNNKELRNIIMKHPNKTFHLFYFNYVSKLKMVNIINMGSGCLLIRSDLFEDCSISLYIVKPATESWLSYSTNLWKNCSINIKGVSSGSFFIEQPYLENSHMNLDVTIINNSSGSSLFIFRSSPRFINSYITGKLKIKTEVTYADNYIFYNLSNNTVKNSYFALEIEGRNSEDEIKLMKGTNYSISDNLVIDSSLIPNLTVPVTRNVNLLTTEQMKDSAYLTEIGFIVVPLDS